MRARWFSAMLLCVAWASVAYANPTWCDDCLGRWADIDAQQANIDNWEAEIGSLEQERSQLMTERDGFYIALTNLYAVPPEQRDQEWQDAVDSVSQHLIDLNQQIAGKDLNIAARETSIYYANLEITGLILEIQICGCYY